MHIELDDALVAEVDRIAGSRGRSTFVRRAVQSAVQAQQRADLVRSAAGALTAQPHEWDADPAEWVRRQRRADARRTG
jgi:Arc/MetJ family transcription regulator